MPEEQDNQIERREPSGINRRSETARRGSDAARFVGGLANRRTESDLPSTSPTDQTFEFILEWYGVRKEGWEYGSQFSVAVCTRW